MARREKQLHKQLFPGWSARDNYAVIVRRVKRKAAITQRSIQRANNSNRGLSSLLYYTRCDFSLCFVFYNYS